MKDMGCTTSYCTFWSAAIMGCTSSRAHAVGEPTNTKNPSLSEDDEVHIEVPEPKPSGLTNIFDKNFDGRQVLISFTTTTNTGYHEKFFCGNNGHVDLVKAKDCLDTTNTIWLATMVGTGQYTFQLNATDYMVANAANLTVDVMTATQTDWALKQQPSTDVYSFASGALFISLVGSQQRDLALTATEYGFIVGFAYLSALEYYQKMTEVFLSLVKSGAGAERMLVCETKYITLNEFQVSSWCTEYINTVLTNYQQNSDVFNSNAAAVSFAAFVSREKMYGKTEDKFAAAGTAPSFASCLGVIWGVNKTSNSPQALNFFITPTAIIMLIDPMTGLFVDAYNGDFVNDKVAWPNKAFV